MLRDITMPRLSESMKEATIVRWLKSPGETVARGEPLLEVETDKSTVVYEAEEAGVLATVLAGEGETVPLGEPVGRLAVERTGEAAARPVSPSITPVARRTAEELGVVVEDIHGTGPGGRITRSDVIAAAATGRTADYAVELSATQRTTATRMSKSRSEIPDFSLEAEIDMTRALELREEVNQLIPDADVSVNDLIVRATSLALRAFPGLNSTFDGERIIRRSEINIAIAVTTKQELLVPVLRNVDRLSLLEVAMETRAAAKRARGRALAPDELSAATFTVSNLGMYGVSSFQAVINPPQAALLAVGASRRRPVFDDGGAVVGRDMMAVTLSCDHRVVYGAEAAMFLGRLRTYLERPTALTLPSDLLQNG